MSLDCLHEICSYLHPRELLVHLESVVSAGRPTTSGLPPVSLAPGTESRVMYYSMTIARDACRRLARSQPTGSYASATVRTAQNLGRTRIFDVRSINELIPDAKLECLIPVRREKRKTYGQSPKVFFHFLEADLDPERATFTKTVAEYHARTQTIRRLGSITANMKKLGWLPKELEDEEFTAHELANVAEPLRDSVWTAIQLELLLVLKRVRDRRRIVGKTLALKTKWDFFLLELDRTAGNVVRKIVDAAGMDPTTTTWAQMDDLEVEHKASMHKEDGVEWRVVDADFRMVLD
ncbi:hypothetical protein C8J57DRAFT_1510627 [Mycena rebaudengoi]|nr:hypothetical protein C8J57DRAFT_1510627 [Mycena rebaudengoi]